MKRSKKILFVLIAVFLAGSVTAVASSIPNGDFEKGNFSGWKTMGSEFSSWSVYDGSERQLPGPPGARPLAPKPLGKYASKLEQDEASTNYLTKTLFIPRSATNLSVKLFWINRGSPPPAVPSIASTRAVTGYWRFPGSWSTTGDGIQFFRLDIVKPGASGFTTEDSDILATLFQPTIGSTRARSRGWKTERINVSRFQGQKIKLRLVEGDNRGFLNVGLDRLRFFSAEPPTG